jgi:hypothetical protein
MKAAARVIVVPAGLLYAHGSYQTREESLDTTVLAQVAVPIT